MHFFLISSLHETQCKKNCELENNKLSRDLRQPKSNRNAASPMQNGLKEPEVDTCQHCGVEFPFDRLQSHQNKCKQKYEPNRKENDKVSFLCQILG